MARIHFSKTEYPARGKGALFGIKIVHNMDHFCCVPGCSNCSDRETHLSFRRLPLKGNRYLNSGSTNGKEESAIVGVNSRV